MFAFLAGPLAFLAKPAIKYGLIFLAGALVVSFVFYKGYRYGAASVDTKWLRAQLAVERQLVETTDEARQYAEGRAIRLARENEALKVEADRIVAEANRLRRERRPNDTGVVLDKETVDAIRGLR